MQEDGEKPHQSCYGPKVKMMSRGEKGVKEAGG